MSSSQLGNVVPLSDYRQNESLQDAQIAGQSPASLQSPLNLTSFLDHRMCRMCGPNQVGLVASHEDGIIVRETMKAGELVVTNAAAALFSREYFKTPKRP